MVINFKGGIKIPQGRISVGPTVVEVPAEPTLSNLSAHYDAQDFDSLTLSTLDVDLWGDLSGNNRNVGAAGADRPTYDATGANGLPAVRFSDSVKNHLADPDASITNSDKTVVSVLQVTSSAASIFIPYTFTIELEKLTFVHWPGIGGYGITTFGSDIWGRDSAEFPTDILFVLTAYFDHENMTTGARFFFNETEQTGLSQVTGTTSNAKKVGINFDMSNVSFPWRGVISELYMIDGLMDGTERDDLIAFLKFKWLIS